MVLSDDRVAYLLKEPRASSLAILTAGVASIVSPTAVMLRGDLGRSFWLGIVLMPA